MIRVVTAALLMLVCHTGIAEIYKWVDKDGQVHYSDNPDRAPAGAETTAPGPVNTVPAPPPPPPPLQPASQTPPQPGMTPSRWAEQNCTVRVRILYTDGRFIPCIPTDEVAVHICEAEVPRKYSQFFGRRYRYEDRESECGPEVYEGEILYLKQR